MTITIGTTKYYKNGEVLSYRNERYKVILCYRLDTTNLIGCNYMCYISKL